MSNRLQWIMRFVLLCICAPPLLALWSKGLSTIPHNYSRWASAGIVALIGCLLWRRRSLMVRLERHYPAARRDTARKLNREK